MPQDITINGAQYPDVPAVQIPKTGGGTAQFDDTTDATATASEIASGKSAYVNNTRLVGTGQMVEPPLYIDDTINSIGIGEAPTATNYLVNTLNSSFRGQYNNFYSMPYSWSTPGVDNVQGYARIATITARGTAGNLAMPIRFEVFRTYDSKPINMYLRLAFTTDYNPSIEGLYYDDNNYGIYNGNFTAFARKTGSGTYDVYVYKETDSTWFGVNTYIPAYMLYRVGVSYANDLYTYVPSDAVMATQMHVENTTKYNTFNYLPYSWRTAGSSTIGWLRIATINIADTQFDAPVEFIVQRRNDARYVKLSVLFNSQNTADPTLSGIYYDDISGTRSTNPFQAFIWKTTTSIWSVYVSMSGTYDSISVYTLMPYYAQRWGSVTYAYGFLSAVPSGATMAKPVPCLTPTVTITKTSGNSTASGVQFYRSGNVCHLTFNLKTTAEISVGSNAWVGTSNAPKPVVAATNASYYGSSVIITDFGASGTITVRINGAALASGSNCYCNVAYLTNE